jgi:predicted RNA-binding protein with PIN domain
MTNRLLASLLAALVFALALLVGGCGQDEQANEYVDRVNAIQSDLVAEITALAADTPSSQEQAADYAREIAAIFSRAADRFAAVEPPQDVANMHAQVVEQIRAIATETRRAGRTLREGTPEEAQKALAKLEAISTHAQNRLNLLIDEINADLHD